MTLPPSPTLIVLVSLLPLSCSSEGSGERWRQARERLIYGNDDRVPAMSHENAALVRLSTASVGALVPAENLIPSGDGGYVFDGPTLESRLTLCPDETFLDLPSFANCTAAVIGDDIIVTAGHCLTEDSLDSQRFVTGYYAREDFPRVAAASVYELRRLLAQVDGDIASESGADFAVAELEPGASLQAIDTSRPSPVVALGDAVAVIGNSEGLPTMIDDGGRIFDPTPRDYFEITSDTFIGGSGSPAFSLEGEWLGIVVGGGVDYTWDEERSCRARRRIDAPTSRAEIVVRANTIQRAMGARIDFSDGAESSEAGCAVAGRGAGASALGWLPVVAGVVGRRRRKRAS